MCKHFIGRKSELQSLENAYAKNTILQLLITYHIIYRVATSIHHSFAATFSLVSLGSLYSLGFRAFFIFVFSLFPIIYSYLL